ncbi:glycosyltransferase [Skermania sp. ID1734]|uniref:glycosyltransferase n=1 Tax=Skermania sp. ID1734 TaxID=2597516 RepID=UPI00117EBE48|nr:nucleotide disphospho-sugar-binding domain-containing protein [Skermania sp. ID1734]TSE01113.1 glycosyltransferase [Skermania sp. ID1734]
MTRILFVVPPLAAHVHPTVAVALELRDRGHDVAWVGHTELIAPMLPADAEIIEVCGDERQRNDFREWFDHLEARREKMRGAAAFRFLWEEFLLPLSVSMFDGIDRAVTGFRPDILAVDQHTLAGAIVARKRGIPWATMAIMSAEIVDPLPPKLQDWVRSSQRDLCAQLGENPDDYAGIADLRFSPDLVIAFTTPALVGPVDDYPSHYRFVGPCLHARGGEFDWAWLDPQRRHVLITLGTVSSVIGTNFLRTAVAAVGEMAADTQAILIDPNEVVESVPPNVLRVAWVPYLELLPTLDAVVCHAGHTTSCEALANAVPLVMAPIRDDQPVTAWQVETAGAGVRVKFGRARPADIRDALDRVLDDAAFREAAGRIRDSFTAAGGARAAADYVEKLT